MRYRNISKGIVIVSGRGQVVRNGIIELSNEEVARAEISPYIGKYLAPIDSAPVVATPVPQTPVITASSVTISHDATQMLVEPPPVKTDEQLSVEKQAAEDEETIGIKKSKKTEDGKSVVQTVEEISRGKVRYAVEKMKAITSYEKRVEYVESIDNPILLEAIEPKFKGKIVEVIQKQLKKLSK